MITVMGATGHTGKQITEALLKAGEKVRALGRSEATRILGERIGKPDLQYVQFSYADEVKALVQAGMSPSFANLYVEMTRAFNEGKVKPLKGRTAENITPTRFEGFAGELARAYAAGA